MKSCLLRSSTPLLRSTQEHTLGAAPKIRPPVWIISRFLEPESVRYPLRICCTLALGTKTLPPPTYLNHPHNVPFLEADGRILRRAASFDGLIRRNGLVPSDIGLRLWPWLQVVRICTRRALGPALPAISA